MLDLSFSQMSSQSIDLPDPVRAKQLELLDALGVKAGDSRQVAKAVMGLSDFYANNPEKSSPWDQDWAKIAYIAYYMPLNWWRVCGVTERGKRLDFFEGFDHYIDFGSGLGSVSLAFDERSILFQSGLCIERSNVAMAYHQILSQSGKTALHWSKTMDGVKISPQTLAIFSYSLTELDRLPAWVNECEGLLIIEPSTKGDARRLQSLRAELLRAGWYVWGPCTHSQACPLLTDNERDWCHDRIVWSQPSWLRDIEDHMPIKNGTLPCSWLMMRRTAPKPRRSLLGRITGDLQEFKGYAKQLVCRGDQREFLSWQKKHFKTGYPNIHRGELVTFKDELSTRGNELRLMSLDDVQVVKSLADCDL